VATTAGAAVASDQGTVAVVAPVALLDPLGAALDRHTSTRRAGNDPLLDPVALLSTTAAKGLEFDTVIVPEPSDLVDEQPRGLLALYIALTRTTDRLVVVHARTLPPAMSTLATTASV
jgi:DNA helicase IV